MANVIRVLGFPPNILGVKLTRFIEKYSGINSVKSVEKRDDGETVISFRKAEHCMQFMDSGLDSMEFGGKKIPLTILTSEDIGDQSSTAYSTIEKKIKSAVDVLDIQQKQLASEQKEQCHHKSDLNTTYYWHMMQQLPAPEGTKCIIVQNIKPTIHYQNIIMHFESKKRSNGGPVECILKLIDGILVVFKNSLDSDQVLSKVGQIFEGEPLKIYPKVIPMFYERKFFISGVAETTSKHTLELFLEKCSKDEATPEICEKQGMTGIYLIEYGNDFDSSEINSLMSKINEEPLEDHKLWISRLLRSDCLKIGNIPANSSNDEIRLSFESKKRTGGGPVTRIIRTKSHTLIYFALFEDAERLYDKYKPFTSQKLYIGGHELIIEMYFPCLVNDQPTKPGQEEFQTNPKEEMKSATVEPFHYSLENIDKSILRMVQNGNYHFQRLQDAFKGIASVSLLLKKKSKIACAPIGGKNSDLKSQREFEKECQKHSDKFFSDYEIIHEPFDEGMISALRKQKVFPLLEKDFKEENGKVMQYWEEENIFVCVGLKKDIPSVIDNVRECISSIIVDMKIDNEQYSKLVNCCILEEIKVMFGDVRVIEDEDMKKITLIGPQNRVSDLQIQALTMLNSIKKKKLAELDLDESLKVFFRDHFKKVSSQRNLEEMFRAKHLKTCFIFEENEFEFFVRVSSNIHEVTKFINDIITTHVMQLEETDDGSLLRSSEWKTFQQKLEAEGKVRIFIQPSNSLLLIGFANEVKDAIQRTRKVLNENMTIDKVVSADFGSAIYALEKSINFTPDWQKSLSITECRLTSQSGGGIYMKVKKCTLEKAVSALKAILQDIVSTPHKLYDAGLNEYFKEEQGKQFLKTTESFLNCIILTSADPQTWPVDDHMIASAAKPSSQHQSKSSKRSEMLASVTLSGFGVVLQVWKDDIIKHKCDIIVNASNSELQLLPQGVSGVIKRIDEKNGNKVQQQMREIIQQNRGSLPPGEAELTTSGGLTNCKKIIHAIGPRWNESYHKFDPKLILKACISQILNKAEKTRLQTIAIPAISCGVFGGKVQDCIPLIVEATVEYFTETTLSCIREVHFIENQKEIVLKEFQKEINLLQPSTSNTTIHPRTTIVPPSALSRNVSLVQGDIADQTADAIVNITQLQPKFMQGTAIAKALAAKAGQNIENQVTLPSSNGSVVKTSAGKLSCKKLYHGFVTTFNNRDSEFNVRSIVSKCLENAETDQYRSIAFPAIATGNFHHPPNLVAKWMKDEISKFTGTYLQAITIVLFPKDQQSISAFNAEFNPLQKMIFPSIIVQTVDSSSVSIGPLTVSVYQGDITQQKSDAIVNSTNRNFDLSQGMISKSITRKGGPQIQAEASSTSGTDLRVTNGGNLACKYIYHIVASTEDEIKTVLIDLMEQAEKKQQIGSISIPALGTGNVGLPCSSVANAMRRALEKFAGNHQTTNALRKINIVVFDKNLLADFRNGVLKTADVQKGLMAKIKGTFNSAYHKLWGSSEESTKIDESSGPLEVLVVSTSKKNNDKALQFIQDEIKKVISTKLIEYETVGDLTEWEKWEIDQVEEKDHVELRDMSNRYMKRIRVQGLTGNVLSAVGAINEILRNFKEAETCSHYVTWQRFTQNTYVDYPPRSSYVLEKAFKAFKGETGSSKVTVPIYHQGTMSEDKIDLADMSANPTIRRISKESESTDIPKHWDDMGNEQCKKITLPVGSSEYNEVLKSFEQTMANRYSSITQIERIQSLSQYKQYTAKKAEVTEKLNKCGSKNVVERRLFHGTSEDDKIIDNGFDRSYAGVHATAYGRGVYFAVNSQYSNGYAPPDTNGNKRMFLADVITGDYILGSSTLVAPPAKTGGMKNDLYDSMVNKMANPEIFVIFKDASAYPTYLITYK